MRVFSIRASMEGKGLGRALSKLSPELSYREMQRLARRGGILLNGERTNLGVKVHTGDRVELAARKLPANPEIAFEVVARHTALLLVSKPAGVAVLPGKGHARSSLASGLVRSHPEISGLESYGLVHRIDRDTSGLVAVALTVESLTWYRAAFRERRVKKRYLAPVSYTHLTLPPIYSV